LSKRLCKLSAPLGNCSGFRTKNNGNESVALATPSLQPSAELYSLPGWLSSGTAEAVPLSKTEARSARAHLIDDETVAKMGHPEFKCGPHPPGWNKGLFVTNYIVILVFLYLPS
jgi:hypothetical protein